MTRSILKKAAYPAVLVLALAGCSVASANESAPATDGKAAAQHDHGSSGAPAAGSASGTSSSTAAPAAGRPGTVKIVRGTPVANIRQSAIAPETSTFCNDSGLPAGEGIANKANTCVSTPIGEVAEHPVRVAASAPILNRAGKAIKVRILVADNQGTLDLNAFTFDESGAAGKSLHEHPGELDERGRPLLHCHLGVTTLSRFGALPGEDYDAAFSGLQGFKGDLTAEITGLPRGTYRSDIYCSGPGHPALTTNVATRVQAFTSFQFRVLGRK